VLASAQNGCIQDILDTLGHLGHPGHTVIRVSLPGRGCRSSTRLLRTHAPLPLRRSAWTRTSADLSSLVCDWMLQDVREDDDGQLRPKDG
jgi:hypothetical protein